MNAPPVKRSAPALASNRGVNSFRPATSYQTGRGMQGESPLAYAKARLTVFDLWSRLNIPGRPGKSCFCPFHENSKTEAFSIYQDGKRWKCFAGCGEGDAADFLALALGVSPEEGCRKLIELAGGHGISPSLPAPRPRLRRVAQSHDKRGSWPKFIKPTEAEIRAIAGQRGLGIEGVSLAAERGLLFCADSGEGRAWIVSDSRRINAQARLLSGKAWKRLGGKKAWTLPGSEAAWPVGLPEARPFAAIALVEGGPDLLAALHLAWCAGVEDRIAPVAMLGSSLALPADALRDFAGKRVRIFPDADTAGQTALARWASKLLAAGAEVDGYDYSGLAREDGKPVKDLNDFAHVCADQWESDRDVIESAFRFARKEGC